MSDRPCRRQFDSTWLARQFVGIAGHEFKGPVRHGSGEPFGQIPLERRELVAERFGVEEEVE